jgi:hypothetical protein
LHRQAYVEFSSQQAATAAKHKIDTFGEGQQYVKKHIVTYSNPNVNPFKTLPKDAPMRAGKDGPANRPVAGNYNDRSQQSGGNYGGNFRGRGGYNRGNMNNNMGGGFNRNFQNPGMGGMGGNFQAPMGGFNAGSMGGGQFSGGFNRGGMMNNMRGGPGMMRGGRGGMNSGGMMGGMPMGGMQMGGMPGAMPGMGNPMNMGMGAGMPGKPPTSLCTNPSPDSNLVLQVLVSQVCSHTSTRLSSHRIRQQEGTGKILMGQNALAQSNYDWSLLLGKYCYIKGRPGRPRASLRVTV